MSRDTCTEVSARMAVTVLLVIGPSEVPKKVETSTRAFNLSSLKGLRRERLSLGLMSTSAGEEIEEAILDRER